MSKQNDGDLPELPDVAELQELPEIPDLPDEARLAELPELPDELPELPEIEELPTLPQESLAESRRKVAVEVEPEKAPAPAPPKPAPQPAAKLEAKAAEPEPPKSEPAAPVEEKAPMPEAELTPVATDAAATSSASDGASAPAASTSLGPDGKPPLRSLDKSQIHMALAAKIALAGSLLPFMQANHMSDTGSVWFSAGAKVLVLLAAFVWAKQVHHNWGPKLAGGMGKLADLSLKPKKKDGDDDKKKSRRQAQKVAAIEHPFPTGLHVVAIVLIVAGFALSLQDPRSSVLGPVGPAETGMLAWSAFTIVHILSYERWGSFNPLFPLMFLAMLFSGIASVVAGFSAEAPWKLFNILGGAIVGGGGGFAAFTIVEAMMQAKKEGDIKKAAAIEARKAARKTKKK